MQPHNRLRILFVDDERQLQEFMRIELKALGHDVVVCASGELALQAIAAQSFDVALLDIRMPGLSGIDVLQRLKAHSPDTEAIMMTGYASEESMVQAMRLGACDYLRKPCQLAEIEAVFLRIQDKKRLKNKAVGLEFRVQAAEGPGSLIGNSPAMAPVQQLVNQIAGTSARVLITGETGTGKEVVARALYTKSARADMPFVPVNCGALAKDLVESELFGHKKNAFTGAQADRKGMFEVANGGTLLLDELAELDKPTQVKLLRFLEAGEIRPVGANEPTIVDVRVISATNRDLKQMVAEGEFREDLLFRLNMFHIHLPPLRDRLEDIPELARNLLARVAKKPYAVVAELLTNEALQVMMNHHWKGNVRELANAMEYAWIVAAGQRIQAVHLPHDVRAPRLSQNYAGPATLSMPAAPVKYATPAPAQHTPDHTAETGGVKTLSDVEMDYILRVYAKNNQNKQMTAGELGISLKTLYNKLHKYEDERQGRVG
jgi:DNA-binding NtrC family response regulator